MTTHNIYYSHYPIEIAERYFPAPKGDFVHQQTPKSLVEPTSEKLKFPSIGQIVLILIGGVLVTMIITSIVESLRQQNTRKEETR